MIIDKWDKRNPNNIFELPICQPNMKHIDETNVFHKYETNV